MSVQVNIPPFLQSLADDVKQIDVSGNTVGEFLDEYYSLRGWTKEGIPDPEKLKELGLDFVLKDMTGTG